MEADWEVEIGGGAPVIEALWPGFVDLRSAPERVGEITEALVFPALGRFLSLVNGAASPLWTSKCDVWEPDDEEVASETTSPTGGTDDAKESSLACYVDLLPRRGTLFAQWEEAEGFCRAWVERLEEDSLPFSRLDLIVRQAIAGDIEGFGITAYVSVMGQEFPWHLRLGELSPQGETEVALAAALYAVGAAIPARDCPAKGA